MYNLDVNFLKDRGLDSGSGQPAVKTKQFNMEVGETVPLIGGVVAMLLLPMITLTWLFIVKNKTATMQKEIQEIEAEIKSLNAKREKVKKLEGEVKKIQQESSALISVIDQIKPWSAILQDISDRTPMRVQIDSIEQNQSGLLTISGIAASYEDVADFLLTLKNSQFLQAQKIHLESANLASNLTQLQYSQLGEGTRITVELPEVVEYQIEAELSKTPASDLLQELDRKGAVGLVKRIEILQEKGLI